MIPYWLMFLLPSAGALFGLGQHHQGRRRDQAFLVMLFVVFAVVIGLRECGGDFLNYKRTVDYMAYETFATSLKNNDPAFTVLARMSNYVGWNIYGVNAGCGVLFLYGLLRFVRTLPDPWLAIAAAVPYMIIVIAMGYIRQGVSIGFILLALIDLDRKAYGWLLAHLAAALLFHIAAVCVFPFIALAVLRKQPAAVLLLGIVGALAYFFLLRDRFTGFYNGYVASQYDSSGALVRLLMNAVPAVVFLALRRRFPLDGGVKVFWTAVSWLCLAMVPLLLASSSSTWIDRVGLFFSPIQLVVFGYIGSVFAEHPREQRVATFLSIGFYGAVMFVWLNYATNAIAWLPYRWLLSPTNGV